jgi:hypothetical protein
VATENFWLPRSSCEGWPNFCHHHLTHPHHQKVTKNFRSPKRESGECFSKMIAHAHIPSVTEYFQLLSDSGGCDRHPRDHHCLMVIKYFWLSGKRGVSYVFESLWRCVICFWNPSLKAFQKHMTCPILWRSKSFDHHSERAIEKNLVVALFTVAIKGGVIEIG